MTGIADKMKADIDLLEKQIDAKVAILKEVFTDVENLELNRNRKTIREVFSVVPTSSISKPSLVKFNLEWSIGFEDYVCLGIDVVNTSINFNMLPTFHVLGTSGVVRSIIFSKDGKCLSFVSPDSPCHIVVAFSKGVFFKSSLATVLADCRWARPANIVPSVVASITCDHTMFSFPLVETHSIVTEEPVSWLIMNDLLSLDERAVLKLLRCVKVACYMRSVKSITQSEFRIRYPAFNCCDFGEWQFFVGSGKMGGLLACSLFTENCVDAIYSSNHNLLDIFGDLESL